MISFLAVTLAHSEIEVMHGSGTTNPSKLFWQAMELMTERSKKPLHLTYRAVGSSTGQKEFVGSENNYEPWNNFGSGDIPMTASRYAELTTQGRKMVHVPFALGGIGVFHSVPGTTPIDLTGCLLARIFSRDITDWGHADIKAANPDMTYTGPIKVVHRVQGSSSTAGFTSYLGQKCPDSWDLGSGSTITWPDGTFEAQGSGGMASFIADPENEGAIGYIDAGHGHNAGLSEIELQNKEGNYLTTKTADIGAAGGVALGMTPSVIPSDPSADFSGVNLYDLSGPTTWPITMISYFYLEQNMTAMDEGTAALLMYFVKFILSEEGQTLAENNLFVKLPTQLLEYNTLTLNSVIAPAGMPTYITETASTTQPQTGAGDYVFSGKRRSFGEYTGTTNAASIATLKAGTTVDVGGVATSSESLAIAGLVLGALGFFLGFIALVTACIACSNSRTSKPRSAEVALPARDLSIPAASADISATKDSNV